ncbi:MAG: type II secretion system protein [Burkholderiales bacterium]
MMTIRDARQRRHRSGRGFSYLGALFLVALMGIVLAAAGSSWRVTTLREREAELIFVGTQYRRAIELYYRNGGTYPRSLEDLVKDPRRPDAQRYLRKQFADPVTGKGEWGIVKAPDGGIMGVYSFSEAEPFKRGYLQPPQADPDSKQKYSDWRFVYAPGGAALAPLSPPKPATKPGG